MYIVNCDLLLLILNNYKLPGICKFIYFTFINLKTKIVSHTFISMSINLFILAVASSLIAYIHRKHLHFHKLLTVDCKYCLF